MLLSKQIIVHYLRVDVEETKDEVWALLRSFTAAPPGLAMQGEDGWLVPSLLHGAAFPDPGPPLQLCSQSPPTLWGACLHGSGVIFDEFV